MTGRIVDLSIDVVERPHITPGRTDLGVFDETIRQGVLRIASEDGIKGNCLVGEFWGRPEASFRPIIDTLKPELIGRDASEREWLWSRHRYLCTRFKSTDIAWAAVDIALWDIAGKATGQPIYKLLGAQRHRAEAYATYPPRFDTAEGFVAEAEETLERGFRAYKIHPGRLATEESIRMVGLVRDRVGPDIALMYDPNCGYRFDAALKIGTALDEAGYRWYEDPVPHHELDSFVELSRRLTTPLAIGDQAPFQLFESAQYVRRQAAPILRGSAYKLGITGLRKLAAMAEAFGLNCEIGTAGNPLTNAANLHVLLSIANCDYYEYLYPEETERFALQSYVELGNDGMIAAPSEPGLGYRLDEDWIAAHRVETLR